MSRIIFNNFRQASNIIKWNWNIVRWKSTQDSGNVKMARIMKKIIDRHSGKRKSKHVFQWMPANTVSSVNDSRKTGFSDGQRRRGHNVGKVLYKYLTELINSGELSSYFVKNAVDITRVKVVPDLSSMNVYWTATGSAQDKEIEEMLHQYQGKLRHLLTSYHVLTHVPHIIFVKDKSMNNSILVEKLLKTADFGPDYVPTALPSPIQETLNTDESNSLSERFRQLDLDYSQADDTCESSDSPVISNDYSDDMRMNEDNYHVQNSVDLDCNMRNNLYGINHEDMMSNLILKKNKSKYRTSDGEPSPTVSLGTMGNFPLPVCDMSAPNYKKLAQTLRKTKVVKAKNLVRKYEQQHWQEMKEEELYKKEQEPTPDQEQELFELEDDNLHTTQNR